MTLLAGCGSKPAEQPDGQTTENKPTPAAKEPEPEILDMGDYTIALVDGWTGREVGGDLDLRNPNFKAADVSDDQAVILIYCRSSSSANEEVADMLERYSEKCKQLDNFICNGVEYLRITTTAGTTGTILYTSYGAFDPDSTGYIKINVGTITDFDKFLPILKTIKLASN